MTRMGDEASPEEGDAGRREAATRRFPVVVAHSRHRPFSPSLSPRLPSPRCDRRFTKRQRLSVFSRTTSMMQHRDQQSENQTSSLTAPEKNGVPEKNRVS